MEVINPDKLKSAVEYFTELRKEISRRTMFERGSETDVEYRKHLAITDLAARQLDQFTEADLEVICANGTHLVEDVISGEAQENVGLQYIALNQPETVEYQVQLPSINSSINVLTGYEQVMDALDIWE